ncbi:Neu5Ac permease [uncultured Eubacterium sp.]|nr:Neu5Ac permease [uncultured Eubacterium sp.]
MKALIERLVLVGAWIDKGCQLILGIQAVMLLALVTVQIFLRQIDVSISWATELSCLLFIWMTLLGSGISSRYLLHIGVDVLKDRLKGKVKKTVLFISHFILLIGLIIFIFSSFEYTLSNVNHMATTMPAISLSWFYCSLPICGAIMFYYTVIQLLELAVLGDMVKLELSPDTEVIGEEVVL